MNQPAHELLSVPSPHEERLLALQRRVQKGLQGVVPDGEPTALYATARYVLDGGGKRVRPVLLLLTAEAFGTPAERPLPVALALEVFHNFTLVHDDIMDHAASRRGRPTVHVQWDESTAILCGDYLMACAYNLLGQMEPAMLAQILPRYHRMVTHLCEGQTLDKLFETRSGVTVQDYLHMIDRKTGALLALAFELGGVIGGAEAAQVQALYRAGLDVGRAFQIQDDLLDLIAQDTRWGKTIGGDLMEGKKTFLLLRALEKAQGEELQWFQHIIDAGGLPMDEVADARDRMHQLGVLKEARDAVISYSSRARTLLQQALPSGVSAQALDLVIEQMQSRLH